MAGLDAPRFSRQWPRNCARRAVPNPCLAGAEPRTKKGQIVYRKIQAGLWKYERGRRPGGDMQTNVTFEAARIAKAIKVGLTAAFHEATKGAGDEPEE
jgi:hypothetical protein